MTKEIIDFKEFINMDNNEYLLKIPDLLEFKMGNIHIDNQFIPNPNSENLKVNFNYGNKYHNIFCKKIPELFEEEDFDILDLKLTFIRLKKFIYHKQKAWVRKDIFKYKV